ncbi:MAG: translation initiation factor IF-3 [Acidimicrobiales bacterium]
MRPGRCCKGLRACADVGFSDVRASCFWAPVRADPPTPPTASGRTYALHEEPPAIAPPTNNEPRINDRIRAREVRLVGPDGEQIGIKPLPEALNYARALDLDLVEVADKANPPVCRVMDYGKYKYETAQKAKESRRKSTNVVIKEMKYRPKIGGGDFGTKTRKVEKFLDEATRSRSRSCSEGERSPTRSWARRSSTGWPRRWPTPAGSRSIRSSTGRGT